MKRIKTVNGYTIYQAATQKDADNYNCEIGNYNIYIAQDIRDYGLTNSYPEWENEDSLAVVIARCNGSNYAVACALADELSDSTVQDMDLVLEIERRLDAGQSLEEVRNSYDIEVQCFTATEPRTCREWMRLHKPHLCGKDYWGGCCGCPEDYIPGGTARGSAACEPLRCGDCWNQPLPEALQDDAALADDELQDGDLEDTLDQAMTEPTEYRVHSFYAGMTGYSITCGGKEVYFGYSCDEVVERFGFNPDDLRYDENNNAVVMMGAEEQQVITDQPRRYLTVISWEDNGKKETCYDFKSPEEIFGRIDMYDCYDEDLSLWLLTPEGPQPCDWHGTWHDPNDPLKMSITLRSTGNVLDLGWGTDH